MDITTRAEWNARSPRDRTYVSWRTRTGFMVHYSAANVNQTVRAIQNYHMDTKGWSDIGYNFLVRATTGEIYEGRGWLIVGAHCAGFNTQNIGVCVIGTDKAGVQDVSDKARAAVRWLYEEAERRAGKTLRRFGHRDRGNTSCPGDELYAWMKAGFPLGGTTTPPPTPGGGTPDWERKAIMALDTINKGDSGADVKKSMGLLAAAGYPPANSFDGAGRPDGVAGDGWDKSCRAFQKSRKIEQDGACGPITWGELLK